MTTGAQRPLLAEAGGEFAAGLHAVPGAAPFEESYWTTRGLGTGESSRGSKMSAAAETGTVLSSAVTLVLTSVGSGVFALPFAFSLAGVGCGALLAALLAGLSWLSGYALIRCCEETRCFSYEELMVAAWGSRGAVLMEVLIVVLLVGAMAAMITLIADALPAAQQLLLSQAPAQGGDAVMCAVLLLVLFPLSCARSLTALSHFNAFGVLCVFSVCAYVVAHGLLAEDGGGVLAHRPAFAGAAGSMRALPIVMLSYCMHVQVPPVYGELERRSVRRFSGALAAQTVSCLALYLLMGVCGLRLFGPEESVPGDVLLGFRPTSRAALALRAAVGASCVFVFPLLSLPCRSTVDHLLFGGGNAVAAPGRHSRERHILEAAALVGAAACMARAASGLGAVTAITGATSGSVLCYVVPFVLFLRLCGRRSAERRVLAAGLALSVALTAVALSTLWW